mmetsp:Transcript_41755/g.110134  ORF Transcript_41755/g.110134 Transcript_41755/m.110134 type:complete len:102 (+) Transcript_41755:1259-1564(+)
MSIVQSGLDDGAARATHASGVGVGVVNHQEVGGDTAAAGALAVHVCQAPAFLRGRRLPAADAGSMAGRTRRDRPSWQAPLAGALRQLVAKSPLSFCWRGDA